MKPAAIGLAASFGFGDRIGLATCGHALAVQQHGEGIVPVFAQQSIREMTRTGRSPEQVISDAMAGVRAAGYAGPHGADADHLKTPADVDRTAAAGFVMFTIDPSDYVEGDVDGCDEADLAVRFRALGDEVGWIGRYIGKEVRLPTGTVVALDQTSCRRAAVKYGRAVNHALAMSRHIAAVMARRGSEYEIELSVDETAQPTTLCEHYIIAHRCLTEGMKLVSLAPRFLGDFEKGVDYKGDRSAFERSLADHAAIAAMLGPYKLSLHSGSDKLSIYAALARHTRGRFHVKTAGTSYLEALRVAARHQEPLFRQIIEFARSRYDHDKASYHVSATLKDVPPPRQVSDARTLEKIYLGSWDDTPPGAGLSAPGRQILHCTFGSVLTDPLLSVRLRGVLESHRDTYAQLLGDHFGRHLRALRAGMSGYYRM